MYIEIQTCYQAVNRGVYVKCTKPLRYEPLALQHSVPLQHLEVVLLIRGMLVHYEDIRVQFGDYKSQVKLTNDFHFCKHCFTVYRKHSLYDILRDYFFDYERHWHKKIQKHKVPNNHRTF